MSASVVDDATSALGFFGVSAGLFFLPLSNFVIGLLFPIDDASTIPGGLIISAGNSCEVNLVGGVASVRDSKYVIGMSCCCLSCCATKSSCTLLPVCLAWLEIFGCGGATGGGGCVIKYW